MGRYGGNMGTNGKKAVFIYPGSVSAVFLLTPLIRALKRSIPGLKAALLTTPEIAGLAKLNPELDTVISCKESQYQGVLGINRLGDLLKSYKFDLAFCFRPGKRYAMATFLAGIPERIGYDTDHAGWFLTKKQPLPVTTEKVRHEGLLKLLNISVDDVLPEFELPREVKESYWQLQERYGLAGSGYIVICPLAGSPEKSLSQATASHLVRHWHSKKRRVYLIGSFENGEELEKIAKFAGLPYTQVLAGKIPLPELGIFLSRAELLLTVDSGPLYLAQQVGCPAVAVFGPTQPPAGRAFTRGTKVLFKKAECSPCNGKQKMCKNYDCIGNISVLDIIRAAEE